ncbi:hypothetical protein [Acidianus sp. HS-5]|uniref:hypothetical protein n=1 Tax=Acidianus sp. HS-5 TaxID=2886040 RepID=UPI001F3EF780|nr:hypothetical protein [Acidianus sp. HS-5]BDC17833.1 hypothetical protein HS5_07230 [Acidianus sp. HS-5]
MNQGEALIFSSVSLILSIILSYLSWRKYAKSKSVMWLFWFLGFVSYFIAALEQEMFALGVCNYPLAALYMFIVAELVLILSLGSVQQVPEKWKKIYYYYSAFATAVLLITIVYKPFTIVEGYVPANYPALPSGTSSMVTIPASGLILFLAAKALLFKGNKAKMISTILAIVVLGSGGMFAASGFVPALYLSQVLGMSLFLYGIS